MRELRSTVRCCAFIAVQRLTQGPVDAAVDDWLKLHFYRTLLVYSAFVLSITRLLHF